MTPKDSSPSRGPLLLDRLAEEFLDRYRRGEKPTLAEYTRAYPELAEDIVDLFPALVEVEQIKSSEGGSLGGGKAVGPSLTKLGDYMILGIIGQGAMGIVYEAVRESLRSRVALKIMHPRYRDHERYLRRFRVEARAAARLHHTNIVSVFDYGEADGFVYYAMPLIVGQSLEKVLEDVRALRNHEEPPNATMRRAEPSVVPTHLVRMSIAERIAAAGEEIAQGLVSGHFSALESAAEIETDWPGSETRIDDDVDDVDVAPPFVPPPMPVEQGADSATTKASGSPSNPPSTLVEQSEDRYYREVARLGAQVADALAYAHKRGVLHRDIKPSNLLLDALGNVWVTDFGLAKLDDGDDLSRSTDVVGTLRYMSPERFRRVSSHSGDIYALGATLYELLTLQPAFEELDQVDLIERITRASPIPPRQHDPQIPRDLQTIILKALAKDPKDRFASAEEMAVDLRLFLDNRPILSRDVPSYERLWRWGKRNPSLASVTMLAAALMVAIALIASFAAVALKAERDEARKNLNQANASAMRALQNAARGQRLSRRIGQRFEAIKEIEGAVRLGTETGGLSGPDRLRLRNEMIAALALPDFQVDKEIDFSSARLRGGGMTFDAKLERYAMTLRDGAVSVRRVANDNELTRFGGIASDDQARTSGFSPDGRYLAMSARERKTLQLWDLDTGKAVLSDLEICKSNVRAWDFRSGGRELAVGCPDGSVLFIELPSGNKLRHWRPVAKGAGAIAFSPDGSRIAVGDGSSNQVKIFDVDTGRVTAELAHPSTVFHFAWSPSDPDLLAVGCQDNIAYVWKISTQKRVAVLKGDTYNGLVVAFHPSGSLLATRGWDAMLRLWDLRTGQQVLSRQSHWGSELFFASDGKRLSSEIESRKARILQLAEGDCRSYAAQPSDPSTHYAAVAIDRQGHRLAASAASGVSLWDLDTRNYLGAVPTSGVALKSLEFDAAGALIVPFPWTLRWPVRSGSNGEGKIGPPELLAPYGSVDKFAMSPDGSSIAVPNYQDGAVVFDLADPSRLRYLSPHRDVRSTSFSPDGRRVVTGTHAVLDGPRLWDSQTGKLLHNFPNLTRDVCRAVTLSPDGRWLVALGDHGLVLIDAVTSKPVQHLGSLFGGVAFSPDSRMIAMVDRDGCVSLVDVNDGHEVACFEDPEQAKAGYLAFSRDGSQLAVSVQGSNAVRVWDLRAIRGRLAKLGLDWNLEDRQESVEPDPRVVPRRFSKPYQVDLGSLNQWLENPQTLQNALPAGYREALEAPLHPADPDASHHRAHLLATLGRHGEADRDFSAAIAHNPGDVHLLEARGLSRLALGDERGAADLDEVIRLTRNEGEISSRIALALNNAAWTLCKAPRNNDDARKAVAMARRAVAIAVNNTNYLNTLGVALYRAGNLTEAVAKLEKSLAENGGEGDAFDHLFLAMAHQRMGMLAKARDHYSRAIEWVHLQPRLREQWLDDLNRIEAEASALLNQPLPDIPDDVFARGLK